MGIIYLWKPWNYSAYFNEPKVDGFIFGYDYEAISLRYRLIAKRSNIIPYILAKLFVYIVYNLSMATYHFFLFCIAV